MTSQISTTTTSWSSADFHLTDHSNATTSAPEYLSYEEICQHFVPSILMVDKYLTPVWHVIGMPANLIAFLVWIQPRMRPSSGCYLAALAMCDFIFLILQLMFELQNSWHIRLLVMPVLCEAFPVLFMTTQYLSPILVLAFTVERYISICHPFRRERFCTTQRAVRVICGLVLLCLLLHSVQAYFWIYSDGDCSIRPSMTEGGSRSVWSIWAWVTELLVFALVPLAILLLNIFVINETRRMSRSEETRLCLRRGHKSSAATVTLLAVSFYLIFTTLPVTVCYVLQLIFVQGPTDITLEEMALHPTWQRHFRFFAIRKIIEEIGMSHYACNFFIYVLTGKLFRLEMRLLSYSLFCKDKMRRWRSQQYNGFNTPSSKLPLPPTLGVIAPPSESNVAPATLTSEEAQPHDSFLPSNHNGNGNGVAI